MGDGVKEWLSKLREQNAQLSILMAPRKKLHCQTTQSRYWHTTTRASLTSPKRSSWLRLKQQKRPKRKLQRLLHLPQNQRVMRRIQKPKSEAEVALDRLQASQSEANVKNSN